MLHEKSLHIVNAEMFFLSLENQWRYNPMKLGLPKVERIVGSLEASLVLDVDLVGFWEMCLSDDWTIPVAGINKSWNR